MSMENHSRLNPLSSLLLFFLIFLSALNQILSKTCKEEMKISNKDCFNDILIFDDFNWRAGHSDTNKNKIFIMEFSNDAESGARLFYGLRPNGRYYFANESPTKEITLPTTNYNGRAVAARYESINKFISLKNDINKENEYFMSISTYYCYMEIHNITEDAINSDQIYTLPYLDNHMFSFKFDIPGTTSSGEMIYYLAFIPSYESHESGDRLSVKKIGFSNFEFNKNDIINTKLTTSKNNDRTVCAFLIDDVDNDDYKILVVIFIIGGRYKFNVYSPSDLSLKADCYQLYGDNLDTGGKEANYGLFFEVLYLGNRDIAMTYFLSNRDNQTPRFQVLTIVKDNNYKFDNKIYYEIPDSLRTDLIQNDFINITESRLVFISSRNNTSVYILLMDLYNDNYNIEMRKYEFIISPYYYYKEFSAHVYNGYLSFSSTVKQGTSNNCLSIFMIFGFGNGTDFIMDISP